LLFFVLRGPPRRASKDAHQDCSPIEAGQALTAQS
jgi:hypothetical protein